MGIVFFDGQCGVCNAFVQFLLKVDRGGFSFAPLQGETARARFGRAPDVTTVIYAEGDAVYERSEAVLRIARAMGGVWSLLWCLSVIPRGLRDPLYSFFARHRHRFFPRRDTCLVPTAQQRQRFLP